MISSRCLSAALLSLLLFAARPGYAAVAPAAPPPDTLFARHDWTGAAAGYRALAAREPKNARAWYRLGFSEGSLGHWQQAIDAYRHADAAGTPPMFAQYNMACAYVHAGSPDSAFAVLGRLMATGYGQTAQLEGDDDLAPLRSDARWAHVLEQANFNATPCAHTPESRQFDFWIGDWDVRDNQRGQGRAGTSHVERILGQCVIFENWTGLAGGSGKSLNAWNGEKQCWQQSWMDDHGDVTQFTDGHRVGNTLSFVADKLGPGNTPLKSRLTFFDLGPDQVRQLGEQSADGGKTWTVRYDFNYVRTK